jgi:hypothetical protein
MPPGVRVGVTPSLFSAIDVAVVFGVSVGNGVKVSDGGGVADGICGWAIGGVGVGRGEAGMLAVLVGVAERVTAGNVWVCVGRGVAVAV